MSQTKKVPLRKCTGCNEVKNKKDMIRVIRDKEGNISMDATGRKNGRGAYIFPDVKCLEKAMKSKGLERTLKAKVPEEVYEQLKAELGEING